MNIVRSPVFLALDVGDVRIGVALSRSGVIAEPLETIVRRGRKRTLDELQRLIETHAVSHLVVGLPTLPSGDEGEQAEKTRQFCRSVARRMPQIEIILHDERYSTSDAREIVGDRIAMNKASGRLDRVSAAVILQNFLDTRATRKPTEEKQPPGGT